MLVVAFLLNTVFSLLIQSCDGRTDSTLLPGQIGAAVVQASVRRIQDTCIFNNDYQLLTRLAWATTQFGISNTTFFNRIDGIWRVEVVDFNQTLNPANFRGKWPSIIHQIQQQLEQNYTAFNYQANSGAMLIPLKNALAARFFFNMLEIKKNIAIPMTVEGQAQWLKEYHGALNITDFMTAVGTMPESCRTPGADILFIMDASGSITFRNWQVMVDFVHQVVSFPTFDISDDTYKFAVDVFSYEVTSRITFNNYTNKEDLLKKIKALNSTTVYTGGGTNTHKALDHAYQYSFTAAAGARDAGRGYPRVAVVLTDGLSNYPTLTQTAAIAARQHGLVLFTVGIGSDANKNELDFIASSPKCTHVYLLKNFNELAQGFPIELKAQTCRSASSNPTGNNSNYSNSLNQNQYQFFQFGANQTAGITFILRVSTGNITLYFSTLFTEPDEVQYDEMFVVTAGGTGEIYINSSTLQQQPNSGNRFLIDFPTLATSSSNLTTVYVSLRGNAQGANSFNLSVAAGDQQVVATSTTTSTKATTHPPSASSTTSSINITPPITTTTLPPISASTTIPTSTATTTPTTTTTVPPATTIQPNQAAQNFDSKENQAKIFSFSVDSNRGMIVEVAVTIGDVLVYGSFCRNGINNYLFGVAATQHKQFTLTTDMLNSLAQQSCAGTKDNDKSTPSIFYVAITGIHSGDNMGSVDVMLPPQSSPAPSNSGMSVGIIIAIVGGAILIAIGVLIITWISVSRRRHRGRRHVHRGVMPHRRDLDYRSEYDYRSKHDYRRF